MERGDASRIPTSNECGYHEARRIVTCETGLDICTAVINHNHSDLGSVILFLDVFFLCTPISK